MHTGLEDRLWDTDKLAAYFAERAKGGAGLIITGGFGTSRTGLLAFAGGKMTNVLDWKRHQRVTKAVHDEGGKIAMQLIHAGRYGYTPVQGRTGQGAVADPPVQAPADDRADHLARDQILRPVGQARAQSRLRRHRDHGWRGLPDQPVPLPAHQ